MAWLFSKSSVRTLAPRTSALSVASLPAPLQLLLSGLFTLLGALRLWRRHRRTTGDFPTMSLTDKIHWLYKADRPLLAAEVAVEPRTCVVNDVGEVTLRIKLNAVGDLLPYARIPSDARSPLEPIASLFFDADVTVANLECPIVAQPSVRVVLDRSATPTLVFSPADFDTISGRHRFDVVATATNHAMDAGLSGIASTIATLEGHGALVVGTNSTALDASRPRILDRGGVKLGFVAATFGLNGHECPKQARHAVDVEPMNALAGELVSPGLHRRIAACRDAGAQLMVASLHWGHEFEFFPRARQQELAQRLVDLGVDVILGHHPHVIQPLELVSSSVEQARQGVVLYSLGSLTKPLNYPAYALAAIGSVGIAVDTKGHARVESAELIPVLQIVEIENGQPRACIETLVSACASADGALATFANEAATYADRVLGSAWRRASTPITWRSSPRIDAHRARQSRAQ